MSIKLYEYILGRLWYLFGLVSPAPTLPLSQWGLLDKAWPKRRPPFQITLPPPTTAANTPVLMMTILITDLIRKSSSPPKILILAILGINQIAPSDQTKIYVGDNPSKNLTKRYLVALVYHDFTESGVSNQCKNMRKSNEIVLIFWPSFKIAWQNANIELQG